MDIKPRLNTILCCCINKLSRLVHPCPSQQFLIKLTTLNILLDWNNWWRRLTFIYSSAWRLLEPNNYLLSHLFKGLTSTDWSIVQLVLWWGQFEMLYSVLNCTKQGHETHVTLFSSVVRIKIIKNHSFPQLINFVTGEAWPVLHHHKNVSKDELWRVLSVGGWDGDHVVTSAAEYKLQSHSHCSMKTTHLKIHIYDHVTEYFGLIGLF